jgi:3-oxoacyl-(acyl-carrier-protein) synthase III
MAIGIHALGSHVPDLVIDNETIAQATGATKERILQRTGIVERRHAPRDVLTSDLATLAADSLLADYPRAFASLGTLLVATSTPDQPQPATAAAVQDKLGLGPVMTFDLNSVCSGFLAGLITGEALAARSGPGNDVLLIGADKYSVILDRTDYRTAALFGDASGAVVLGKVPDRYGLRARRLWTHGEHRRLVQVVGGGSARPLDAAGLARGDDRFRMQGRLVREYALTHVPEVVRAVLHEAGMQVTDVDRWIFHQGNVRMVDDLADALGIDPDRVPKTAQWCGNTGAASLPVTLVYAQAKRPFQRGEVVMFVVIGGGMTVGAVLLIWY